MKFCERPERQEVSYLVNGQESEKLPPRFGRKTFSKIFSKKFGGLKNPPYLCKRFSDKTEAEKKRVLWKTLYRQTRKNVVRGVAHYNIYDEWNETRNRQLTWKRQLKIGILKTENNFLKDILQRRVWSWLRMNASYRLNTCKSRGSMLVACNQRWRPAHGWVTRIQPSAHSGIAFRKKD